MRKFVRGISIDVGELIAELDRASHKESASILIVDDEPANLRLIEIYLKMMAMKTSRSAIAPS